MSIPDIILTTGYYKKKDAGIYHILGNLGARFFNHPTYDYNSISPRKIYLNELWNYIMDAKRKYYMIIKNILRL